MKLGSTSCNVYMYCSHDTIFQVFKGDLVMYLVGANFTLELFSTNLKTIQIVLSIVLSIPTIYCFNSFKVIRKLY
jgi:hypothetical protein